LITALQLLKLFHM